MHKSNNSTQNKWPEKMSRVKYEDEQGVKNIHTQKTPFRFSFSAASAHFLVLLSFALFVALL